MAGSKLRHTPHRRGPDLRDQPLPGLPDPAACHGDVHVSGCLHGLGPGSEYGQTRGPDDGYRAQPRDSALDAPLPDSREASRDDARWADWRERLERLLHDPGLSERTQSLLESFDEQLTAKGYLSPRQCEIIEEVEERRDGGRSRY